MIEKTDNKALFSKNKMIVACLLSLVAAYFGGTAISYVVSFFYIIFALVQPLPVQGWFVIIGIVNTKGLGFAGISASVLICFVTVILRLFSNRNVNRKLFILCCIFFVYSLQFCFRQAGLEYGLIFPIKMLSVLVFYYYLNMENFVHRNLTDYVYHGILYYLFGTCGAVIGSIGGTGRFAIYGNDPNALGVQMAFIFSVLCILFFRKERITIGWFTIYSLISLFIGALTGSRTFLVLFICIVLLSILFNIRKKGKTMWLVIAMVLAVSIFMASDIGKNIISVLMDRQAALVSQDNISNGRTDLWLEYINYFNANKYVWLFGCGTYVVTGIPQVAHNMIIEGIVSYGIIGLIILFCIYLLIIKSILYGTKYKAIKKYLYLPLFVVFLGNFVLHDLTNIYNTTMIFLSFMLISSIKEDINH